MYYFTIETAPGRRPPTDIDATFPKIHYKKSN